jgi:RNA polymerase sigma-70 factor (ECF subfamily)
VHTALALDPVTNLYRDHHRWLHGWLKKRLGCSHQAADIAQDTFVRIMGSRAPSSNAAGWEEPRAYLTTVARNLVADHWRRQELERAYLAAIALLPEPEAPSPETRLLILESLLRIDHALSTLPAVTRRIFLRSQLDGLIYADIAAEMELSLATVKRHMSRAFLACLQVA